MFIGMDLILSTILEICFGVIIMSLIDKNCHFKVTFYDVLDRCPDSFPTRQSPLLELDNILL